MSLTADQIIEAWKLRARHNSYAKIGAALGVEPTLVRDTLFPHRAAGVIRPRKRLRRVKPRQYESTVTGGHYVPTPITVPRDVLFERERVMLAPRSLTAELLGDPLPGRSALDKLQTPLCPHADVAGTCQPRRPEPSYEVTESGKRAQRAES